MKRRIIIYQVLPRIFGNKRKHPVPDGNIRKNGCGKLGDFTTTALNAIRDLGCNYIWYTGIISHASATDYSRYGIPASDPALVKGRAGSPYAIRDYYSICPDLIIGNQDKAFLDFKRLVDRSHRAGLKVLIDFVPNHVAADYIGTRDAFTDANFYPSHYHDGDWTDTQKLNYYNRDTWEKMLRILFFWIETGIDGFRCDMAELVPCEFWEWAIPQVKAKAKERDNVYSSIIFIAEVYNPYQYRDYITRGHFDYLYDKVGLYDTLKSVVRGASASLITQSWQSVDDINDKMLNFLENHDEQRIPSPDFAGNAINARPALLVSALMRNNPFMLYFAQHLGEPGADAEGFSGYDGKTSIFDYWSLPSLRHWSSGGKYDGALLNREERQLHTYYSKVLNFCNSQKAFREGEFFDIMYANYDNPKMDTNLLYAFLRKRHEDLILVVANFSDTEQHADIVIPDHAFDTLQLPETKNQQTTDLLTDIKRDVKLVKGNTIPVVVPPHDGLLLKMVLK